MRTIAEIICAVGDQQPVTEEELKLALLSVHGWAQMAHRDLHTIAENTDKLMVAKIRAGHWKTYFPMMKASPDTYLGPNHTPGTPENDQLRRLARGVFKAATGRDLDSLGKEEPDAAT